MITRAAAVYARFSTDLQKDTSIEDQVRLCREKAKQLGLTVVAVHSDAATKGSSPVGARKGGKGLLEDAMAGRFGVLIVEGLDRLSRDSVDQEVVVRRLEHRGVRIIGIADGYDSESSARKLARGVRGLTNEAYLDDLRHKTHRGLSGQISRGFHAGGLSYGYKSIPVAVNSRGEAEGYRLEIDEDKARVVRRIFDEFGAGRSCQNIAHTLNKEGIPGPRGTWSVAALYGSPDKGAGVLNNELYVGKYIWNRSKWVRDPDSHKRVRLVRPRQEWMEEERPELRILSDEQWQKVRDRMQSTRSRAKPRNDRRSTLLGGLVCCGICGGSVIAINRSHYGCVNHKDRGTTVCKGVSVSRSRLELILRQYILTTLLSRENIAAFKGSTEARSEESRAIRDAEVERRKKRNNEIQNQIKQVVDILIRGDSSAVRDRLALLEVEQAELHAVPLPPIYNVDGVNEFLDRARTVLNDLEDIEVARKVLCELLNEARLIKLDGEVHIEAKPQICGFSLGVQNQFRLSIAANDAKTPKQVFAG